MISGIRGGEEYKKKVSDGKKRFLIRRVALNQVPVGQGLTKKKWGGPDKKRSCAQQGRKGVGPNERRAHHCAGTRAASVVGTIHVRVQQSGGGGSGKKGKKA